MSSYVQEFGHPSYRIINHHRYKYLQSYARKQDAVAEATRWNQEVGISAKVTQRDGLYTVWVSEKRNWMKRV